VAENLSNFVANGGTLVMSYFSGLVDVNDRILTGGFPAPFRRLLGILVEEIETLEPQHSRHVRAHDRAGRCGHWFDLIELEGAEALATFTEDFFAGKPAITRNAFGRGLAYYVGTQVEMEFLRRLLVDICEETGIRPPLRVPTGVEAVRRENEHGQFLFLLNHTASQQHIDLGSLEGMDLLANAPIGGAFPLAPRDVKVIQLG
jgi:beta-galactosidase